MSTKIKLNDLQLVLLASAAAHATGSIFPIPDSLKANDPRLGKALKTMLGKNLIAEVDVAKPAEVWRTEENRRVGLVITDPGREAIAVESAPDAGKPNEPAAPVPAKAPGEIKAGTKQAQLVEMLEREEGASLDEIVAATSWLPHSARAMLTGLKKRGYTIDSEKMDGVRRYRATKAAA
jgi:hypothetical protein